MAEMVTDLSTKWAQHKTTSPTQTNMLELRLARLVTQLPRSRIVSYIIRQNYDTSYVNKLTV